MNVGRKDPALSPADQPDRPETTPEITNKLDPTHLDHATFMDSVKFGWGNGERKFMIVSALSVVVAVISAVLGVWAVATRIIERPVVEPYRITVPGRVASRVAGIDGPATDTNSVLILTSQCNSVDAPLLLNMDATWVGFDTSVDRPNMIVSGQSLLGVTVAPGGHLCDKNGDNVGDDKILSTLVALPPEALMAGGIWQYQSQITVHRCLNWTYESAINDGTLTCTQPAPDPVAVVGWFSEKFTVVPQEDVQEGASSGVTVPPPGDGSPKMSGE